MKKKWSRLLLVIMSSMMIFAGCRAHKTITKYGVPATKYGIQTSEFMQKTPNLPNQKG